MTMAVTSCPLARRPPLGPHGAARRRARRRGPDRAYRLLEAVLPLRPAGLDWCVISKNGDAADRPRARCWPTRARRASRRPSSARATTSSGRSSTPPRCVRTPSSSRARSASSPRWAASRRADGRVLAEQDDEQGIRRQVLLPGTYRLNPYGYRVEKVPMTEIKPGYVGVKRRLLGVDGAGQFADEPDGEGHRQGRDPSAGPVPDQHQGVRGVAGRGRHRTRRRTTTPKPDGKEKNTALRFYGAGRRTDQPGLHDRVGAAAGALADCW